MTLEQKARRRIDRQLGQCGWLVQIEAKAKRDRKKSLFAGPLQAETGFIPVVAVQ